MAVSPRLGREAIASTTSASPAMATISAASVGAI
jgi:hypothetical protein